MLVEHHFGLNAMNGDLFIFLNRRCNQIRLLFWDRDGFCIVAKKLEQGTFRRVRNNDSVTHAEIDAAELALLLEGIDAKVISRKKRYQYPSPKSSK